MPYRTRAKQSRKSAHFILAFSCVPVCVTRMCVLYVCVRGGVTERSDECYILINIMIRNITILTC